MTSRTRLRARLGGLASALALLLAPMAVSQSDAAQPATGKNAKAVQSAAALLSAGTAALQARDFAAATQNLTAAYRADPGPEVLFQLGALAIAQDQVLAAQDYFRRYLLDAPAEQASAAERSREIQRVLALPRPPAGEALVLGARGALVYVDDRLLGALPLPLPLLLPTGVHTLALETRSGRATSTLTVRLGRTHELRFSRDNSVALARLLPAVMVLSDMGGLPAAITTPLTTAVERVLQREQISGYPAAVALAAAPQLSDCLTKTCPSELLAAQGVPHLLVVRASSRGAADPSGLRLSLELHDTEVGDLAVAVEKICEPCTAEKAAATVSDALSTMIPTGLSRPRGTVVVSSTPEQAEVRFGERRVGVTPLKHAAWPGVVKITVQKPGFVASTSTTWLEQDKTATLELSLAPEAPPPPEPPPAPLLATLPPPTTAPESVLLPRPRWRLITGGVAAAVGVVLTGFGASALAVNKTCIVPTALGECSELYRTDGIGGGLVGAGSVLVVLGTTLLAVPGGRRYVGLSAQAESPPRLP